MSEKSFNIEYTSEKEYDLEELSKNSRKNEDSPLAVKVITDEIDLYEGVEGELAISSTEKKISISRKDKIKYLFQEEKQMFNAKTNADIPLGNDFKKR